MRLFFNLTLVFVVGMVVTPGVSNAQWTTCPGAYSTSTCNSICSNAGGVVTCTLPAGAVPDEIYAVVENGNAWAYGDVNTGAGGDTPVIERNSVPHA